MILVTALSVSLVVLVFTGFFFLQRSQRAALVEMQRTIAQQQEEAKGAQFRAEMVALDQRLETRLDKVHDHLRQAEAQLQKLYAMSTPLQELNGLLKMPHLRGGFGEATLEKLLADFLPQGGYELQYRIVPNSTERVDAVVHYPKGLLPIDSKFPREQVLPLFEASEPHVLEQARRDLAEVIRVQARSIREKYIRPEHGTTEMALLFVPSETLYFEILRHPKLGDELARQKVFAVSPNTLGVTLHAISIARGYYEMAQGVEKTISEIRKSQAHFESFAKRFDEVGTALNKAQTVFGTASTHLQRYSSAVSRLTGAESPLLSNETVLDN